MQLRSIYYLNCMDPTLECKCLYGFSRDQQYLASFQTSSYGILLPRNHQISQTQGRTPVLSTKVDKQNTRMFLPTVDTTRQSRASAVTTLRRASLFRPGTAVIDLAQEPSKALELLVIPRLRQAL